MSVVNLKNKLTDISNILNALLNTEFKSIYVLSKRNPYNNGYKQQLLNVYAEINKSLKNLFDLSNDINAKIKTLKIESNANNEKIESEKTTNASLKNDLGMLDGENSSANELISDYKNIYEDQYLQNWSILLSIFACIYAFNKY